MRVLDRSCLREAGINFLFYGASYLALISVVICAPLLKQGAPLSAVLRFLPDNLMFISMLALPLAMVTAQLTTIGRMREDGEITALMAAGVSTLKIVMALLPLSLVLALWLGFSAHVMLPFVAKRLIEGRAEVLRQATATQVSRRAPIYQTDEAMVAAVGVDGDRLTQLFGVYLEKDGKGLFSNGALVVCFAPWARFVTDPDALSADQAAGLELHDAWFFRREAATTEQPQVLTGILPVWSLRLPQEQKNLSDIQDSMTTAELHHKMSTTVETAGNRGYIRGLERAWHIRWIIPVAVVAYWAFASGLALWMGRGSRLLSVFIGLLTVVTTLVPAFGVVKNLGGQLTVDAGWILWPPVLLLALFGSVMLWRQR
ncbi:MAG: LptF/LptG family permease [Planctomycetes bacterium]|nr:LptF/LptG family permease [Planctomycetota bacterium]